MSGIYRVVVMEQARTLYSNKPISFQGQLRAHDVSLGHRPSAAATRRKVAEDELRVLVINASQDMAKEITLELTLALPGCSIMFAPTLALAKSILARREIDLVVSSQILPDGNVSVLREALNRRQKRPDLVVIGGMTWPLAKSLENAGYRLSSSRDLSTAMSASLREDTASHPQPVASVAPERSVSSLGADLRNDLNNPLQEIVAMVFVAKKTQGSSGVTTEALDAIDRAAKNMANVVREIEQRIRSAIAGPPGSGR